MADQPGWLSKLESASKIIGGIGVPIVLAVAGWKIADVQRAQDRTTTLREQVLKIGELMTSADKTKRDYGTLMLRDLNEHEPDSVPKALIELASAWQNAADGTAEAVPPPPESAPSMAQAVPSAGQALDRAARDATVDVLTQANLANQIAPRLYMHVASEDQRAMAATLEARLEAARFGEAETAVVVPGIQKVPSVPNVTELRVFKQADLAFGKELLDWLAKAYDGPVKLADLSSRYEQSTAIRPRHYELWFNADPIRLASLAD